MLTILCGRSGSGKTSIEKALCQNLDMRSVASYTTRTPRYKGELGHIFITDEEFDALENKIAIGEYGGARYCVTPEILEVADIFVCELDGLRDIRKCIPEDDLLVILLDVSEDVSRARMQKRGDTDVQIEARIQQDREWFNVDDVQPDIIIDASMPFESVYARIAMLLFKNI